MCLDHVILPFNTGKMAEVDGDEREPLLQSDRISSTIALVNEGSAIYPEDHDNSGNYDSGTFSPVGPCEVPPPYLTFLQDSRPMVTCRVCQTLIDVTAKGNQHVVKCQRCDEATPIKNPPAGKKYLRCKCNCLLICKAGSLRVACPRSSCKLIINVTPGAVLHSPLPNSPGVCRVICAYCHDTYVFNTLNNALGRCPHCRKLSTVGSEFARSRGVVFLVLCIIFLIIGIGLTAGTASIVHLYPGLYVPYIVTFIMATFFFGRAIYYFTIKVSEVEGPV